MSDNLYTKRHTLCWECGRACGGCSWSSRFEPVEGWVALPVKQAYGSDSYIVAECPMFVRDAIDHGVHRLGYVKPKPKKRNWKNRGKKKVTL